MINFLIENNTNKIDTQFIVYKIINNINNKIYIGQTFNSIRERIRKHISDSINKPKCLIDKSISKYGYNNVKYEIIDYASSLDELNNKEIYWINFYNSLSPNGYNLSIGGRNHITTEETKEKLRRINLGKKVSDDVKTKISNSLKGEKNHFYGKTHSEETRLKMSKFQKGKTVSEESKLKMSNSQIGRKHTEETLLKMSLSALKRPKIIRPILILDTNLNILKEVINIHECSKYIKSCTRNIYDAINEYRPIKEQYYVLYKENFNNDIKILMNKQNTP